MKPKLIATPLLVVLFLSATTAFSQNAFYDAKKIVRWSKMNDASPVKVKRADTISALIEYYYNAGSEKRRGTPFLDSLDKVARQLTFALHEDKINPDDLLDDLDSGITERGTDTAVQKLIDTIRKAYDHFKTTSAALESLKATPLSHDERLNKIKAISEVTVLYASFNGDSLLGRELDSLAKDSALKLGDRAIAQLWENKARTQNFIYETSKTLPATAFILFFPTSSRKIGLLTNRGLNNKIVEQNAVKSSLFISKASEEIKIKLEQTHQINVSAPNLVDLNFPSQSDIIDAIAIYLAKRTKQEAALFFLEQLEKTIARDDLAQDLFPETWKVMRDMDYNLSPRFGAKWQNAISADYINLPVNIKASRFIIERLAGRDSTGYKYFCDAMTFAGYVGKKFNFLDIVRTFYYNPGKLQGEWTKRGIQALHIINTELRDSSSDRYNWIHPQDWLSLSKDEVVCLLQLIEIKYNLRENPLFRPVLEKIDVIRTNFETLKPMLGELLTMLRQFNVVQQESAGKNKDGTIVASDGFWDAQRNLIDFLLEYKGELGIIKKEENALNLCKSGFFIYDHLSNKNYAGAASMALDVIAELTNKDYRDLIHFTRADSMVLARINGTAVEVVRSLNQDFLTIKTIPDWQARLDTMKNLVVEGVKQQFEKVQRGSATIQQVIRAWEALPADERTDSVLRAEIKKVLKMYVSDFSRRYDSLKNALDDILTSRDRYLFKNATDITLDMLANSNYVLQRRNNEFFKWLSDFSGLLTDVSSARKSEDLAKVIESYALPPGSYRIKRSHNFSIDLNAFTGVFVGRERIEGNNKVGTVYGITAPVGFAFSWSFNSKKAAYLSDDKTVYLTSKGKLKRRTQSSITVDASIIDVGAVFSYRLNNSAEGLPNEVKWDQIIAPALNVRIGLKHTPFVLGVGIQRTPKLRSITAAAVDPKVAEPSAAVRLNLTAAFDLPLINIYRSR